MSKPIAGLLGPGARYEGDLTFEGRVRIDGTLVGSVRSEDFLEIGEGGVVEGEVDVAQVLVAGTVKGLLRARERATLLPSAHVSGQVVCPWLDVRPGAVIRAEVVIDRREGA